MTRFLLAFVFSLSSLPDPIAPPVVVVKPAPQKKLTATQIEALNYLRTIPAGAYGFVKTATAKALDARGLIIAARTRPGDLFERGYMRCVLA